MRRLTTPFVNRRRTIMLGLLAAAILGVFATIIIRRLVSHRIAYAPMMFVEVIENSAPRSETRRWSLKLAAKINVRETILDEIPLDPGATNLQSLEGKWVEIDGTLRIGAPRDLLLTIHAVKPQEATR